MPSGLASSIACTTAPASTLPSGGACSVTVSSGYGAGMIARGTGIWLNNCLGEQELNPRGLHGLPPGSRLLSNMAPTVARHDDGTALAIGSPGADRITTAIAQVLADRYSETVTRDDAVRLGAEVLAGADGTALTGDQLEVAFLDRTTERRAFVRLRGPELDAVLGSK